jgi:hypothetical protein
MHCGVLGPEPLWLPGFSFLSPQISSLLHKLSNFINLLFSVRVLFVRNALWRIGPGASLAAGLFVFRPLIRTIAQRARV